MTRRRAASSASPRLTRRCARTTATPSSPPAAPSASSPTARPPAPPTTRPRRCRPDDGQDWEGDGTLDMSPDDGEWGGDAKAHGNNLNATRMPMPANWRAARVAANPPASASAGAAPERGRQCRAALPDRIAERRRLPGRPAGRPGAQPGRGDEEQVEDLTHSFTMALSLLHNLEPAGVGARNLGECLSLQLHAMQRNIRLDVPTAMAVALALRICEQPMDLLARRDVKRLVQLCGGNDAAVRDAIALIARLEPKPGRRFIDVERNVVVPDVLVTKISNGAQARFRVVLNPEVMPKAARARHLCQCLEAAQGRRPGSLQLRRPAAAPAGGALVHQEHPAALRHHPARQHRHRRAAEELLQPRRAGHAPAGAARDRG